jgi:hypothetical protein
MTATFAVLALLFAACAILAYAIVFWPSGACTGKFLSGIVDESHLSGRYAPYGGLSHKGGNPSEWPEDLRVKEWPKGDDHD